MIYTDLTRKAIKFCIKAHEGQFDKSGLPYMLHPLHVAEQMEDEISTCIALLHDVVEDTDCSLEDVRKEGFPEEVIEAVSVLTKQENISYMDYIKIVKSNPIAVKVKLADIEHNSDMSRLIEVKDEDIKRLEKYKKAKEYLLND